MVYGQTTSKRVTGVPDDWSHHHLIFSDPGTYEQAVANGTYSKWIKIQYDPRFIFQTMKRNGTAAGGYMPKMTRSIEAAGLVPALSGVPGGNDSERLVPPKKNPPAPSIKKDWSEYMNSTTAKVGEDNFPAKYSFATSSPSTANCAGGTAPDFVAYNTGVGGSSTQASIIAYDNLYATTCTGTNPLVYWAYDTGGTISTSVSLSGDGSQLAMIHGTATASLVLLKWSATGGAFTGTTTAGSVNVTGLPSGACTSLLAGEPVYGTTIPAGDTVASCSGTTLVLSTGTGVTAGTSQPLTYNNQFQAALTGSSATVSVPTGVCSVTNIVGAPIYGTGIPQGDTVKTCASTTLTLNTAASTSESSETITFQPATAAAPTVLTTQTSAANYRSCVAPCMYTIAFSKADGDTNSSPFVDYSDDTLYVGDSKSWVYQFTGVFKGPPAISSSGWPVQAQVGGSHTASSVVWDSASQFVFVNTYTSNCVKITSGGSATGSTGLPGNGNDILEGPIVDSSAGQVYIFVDGTTGAAGFTSDENYIAQLPTSFTSSTSPILAYVGTGASSNELYRGAFDNGFYTNSGTGNLYVCGDTDGTTGPTLYQVPISSGTMTATSNAGPKLTTATAKGPTCTPVTEIYNSSGSVPVDWIFAGVTEEGAASGCGGAGCVIGVPVTSWVKSTTYALDQMVVDSHFNIEKVTTAGTSGSSTPSWPAAGSAGTVTSDGSTLKWTSEGPFTFTGFTDSHAYALNAVIVDANGNLERVTTAGTSAGSAPSWATGFGATTASGSTLVFTNQGPLGIVSAEYDGGTSGIIIDNTSNVSGASNIYFTTLGAGTTGSCATTPSTYGGCAIQASQSNP
jgi:hypothetical protein